MGEKPAPNPVYRRLRKVGMRRHPASELGPGIDLVGARRRGAIEQGRQHFRLGTRMIHLDTAFDIRRPQILVDRMIEYDVFEARIAELELATEESRKTPELILAPVFVRVIMTLRTIEAAPQKDSYLLGHSFRRRRDHVVGK